MRAHVHLSWARAGALVAAASLMMAAESAVAAEVRHTALGANNQLRSPVLSSRGLNVESRAILLQAEPWLMTDQSVTRLLGEVHSLRERAVMYAVLSELRPKNRANVVYFSTDGRPYSNRDVFRRTAWQEQRPSLGADDCGSGAVGTTYYCGYFHRRYSDNTRGSSEIKFTSNLPCTSTNIETPRNESTYLMGAVEHWTRAETQSRSPMLAFSIPTNRPLLVKPSRFRTS